MLGRLVRLVGVEGGDQHLALRLLGGLDDAVHAQVHHVDDEVDAARDHGVGGLARLDRIVLVPGEGVGELRLGVGRLERVRDGVDGSLEVRQRDARDDAHLVRLRGEAGQHAEGIEGLEVVAVNVPDVLGNLEFRRTLHDESHLGKLRRQLLHEPDVLPAVEADDGEARGDVLARHPLGVRGRDALGVGGLDLEHLLDILRHLVAPEVVVRILDGSGEDDGELVRLRGERRAGRGQRKRRERGGGEEQSACPFGFHFTLLLDEKARLPGRGSIPGFTVVWPRQRAGALRPPGDLNQHYHGEHVRQH